jgi:Na+-transporting methylmalonyl-CoA/oxaloacetate decarboxylase gamma subunit
MNTGSELILGLNTTVISMGIVFVVLIALAIMIVIQSKILGLLSKQPLDKREVDEIAPQSPMAPTQAAGQQVTQAIVNKGLSRGETKLVGLEDEEQIAVIMAAVSSASNIPLSGLRIRSIKKVDDTWDITAKQEKVNQRL